MYKLQISFDRLVLGLMTFTKLVPVAYLSQELSCHEQTLSGMIHQAIHVIQQLQSRRLAIDFLSLDSLATIYQDLVHTAQQRGMELLIRYPGDLFQIIATYSR